MSRPVEREAYIVDIYSSQYEMPSHGITKILHIPDTMKSSKFSGHLWKRGIYIGFPFACYRHPIFYFVRAVP